MTFLPYYLQISGNQSYIYSVTTSAIKKIWKKTIKGAFLYVFPSWQVQVGQQNFNQIIIYREKKDGDDFFVLSIQRKAYINKTFT